MSTITTYTRKHFDPVHPDPGLLCVEDFAHALPMICRGNGHVTTFWSVGEHCICCAKEAAARGYSRRLVLACLLHDASECYMSDVPRPLKQEMPRYREIEDHLLSVIYEKYLGSDLTAEEQRMMKQPRQPHGERSGNGGDRRPAPRPKREEKPRVWQPKPAAPQGEMSFEDMMARYKTRSEEKIADLKRVTENHRGGYSRRRG